MARLVAHWNSQEQNRDVRLDEAAASLRSRGRLASFIPEGSKILDVACGTTANVEWFTPRGSYFGTDICFGFLRLAHKPEKRLTCANGEALPFADGAFDAATLTFALEHTVNPVGVLREMCRVVGNKPEEAERVAGSIYAVAIAGTAGRMDLWAAAVPDR